MRNSFVMFLSVSLFPTLALAQEERRPVTLSAMEALDWSEVAPGVWSATIGEDDAPTFREFAGGEPRLDALEAVGDAAFPFLSSSEVSRTVGDVRAGRTSVTLPLADDEQIYGLGLHFRGIHRRGEVWHLRTDHYGGVPGRTHAPVPFYVSSRGYGVLFNTTRWVSVYPGIGNRKDGRLPPIRDRNTDSLWQARPTSYAVEASVAAEGMEVIVFGGDTPLDAVRRYNLYFGGGALPPRWGLGFWHRTPTTASDAAVIAEVEEFRTRGFPLDVIGLEPGWQSKAYPGTFDWDPGRFPDPAGFISDMSARDIRVNLWENPYLAPESSMYEAMEPHTGSHMVWLGVVPDYTLSAARAILTEHHERRHLDIGVSGYKIDEVDGIDAWLWPDHARFPSGTSAEVMRQTYGLQLQHMLTGIFRDRNERTYGLARGSNGGASAHPWVIYSDHYSHSGYIAALCNSSFAGVLWTPEIRSARTDAEWVRRMQTVCLSPMAMLNAWASGLKPWSRPDVGDAIRDAMVWRIRLLPYLYSAFARYRDEGVPSFRAMPLEPGFVRPVGEDGTYAVATRSNLDAQYMMGDHLLIAPLTGSQTSREVILPQGKWFDFHTGKLAGEGEVIEISPALETMPIFVRDGGIVPLLAPGLSTSDWKEGVAIEARHYGTAEGAFQLYDDDGETYDYEDGERAWHRLSVSRDDAGALSGEVSLESGEFPRTFGEITWKFMTR